MRLFLDDTELYGATGASIPDTRVIGGFAVTRPEEGILLDEFRRLKHTYGAVDLPLKWNMRDYTKYYHDCGAATEHDRILRKSDDWRRESLQLLDRLGGVTILFSVVHAYSPKRKLIKATRRQLTQYAFANLLQRYCFIALASGESSQVVLDWPDGNDRRPFEDEYHPGYYNGLTAAGHSYKAGSLRTSRCEPSPLYANSDHYIHLQLADILVGAFRQSVEIYSAGIPSSCPATALHYVRNRIYKPFGRIMGTGIVMHGKVTSPLRTSINRVIRFEL